VYLQARLLSSGIAIEPADARAIVASFENRPKPHMRRQLRTLYSGKLEKDMSAADVAAADRWIDERYLFGVHPDQRPTLDWFLETAEVAVIRRGARIVLLDPWNRLEGGRPSNESETDYIGRCLRAVYSFAHDLNCHVQIIAHPAKMDSRRRGDPPSLEDISGSKHWENMVDQGFVVHRPEAFDGVNRKTEATLFHRKARFEELGYPCKLGLRRVMKTVGKHALAFTRYSGQPKSGLTDALAAAGFTGVRVTGTGDGFCAVARSERREFGCPAQGRAGR
jgi:twinkle protein